MGRPKIYGEKSLRKAVERYFRSIGRTRTVTELVDSGEVDRYGHPVMVHEAVSGDDGAPLTEWHWIRPPTVGGLCGALGVNRSTWERWADDRELGGVVEWARDVMRDYLETEILTREGKNVRGVEFMLSANYGVSEKKTLELGADTLAGLDMSRFSDEELVNMAALAGCEDEQEEL